MTAFVGEIHPLAAEFPMIGADELADLAQSIADNGQYDPITLTPDGVLLDGRNRLAACEMAGLVPKFETFDGDPVPFIVGKNATRRNLSAGQRAMAVARGMWELGLWDEPAGRWSQRSHHVLAGARTRVTSHDLSMAGAIQAHSLDRARDVLAGSASLRATYDAVLAEKADKAERDRRIDTLREREPDLYRLATDDREAMTLDEAWAAFEERTKAEREAAERDEERRREQATTLAQSLSRLGALTVDEARARIRSEWDPALSRVNPAEVTPTHMRAVAAALTRLAKEWPQ